MAVLLVLFYNKKSHESSFLFENFPFVLFFWINWIILMYPPYQIPLESVIILLNIKINLYGMFITLYPWEEKN